MADTSLTGSKAVAPDLDLATNVLGFRSMLFQALGHIGPAAGVVLAMPFIALYAGASLPFVILLATVTALLIGNSVAQLARHLPSAGGFYTYVGRGLGPKAGYLTAWLYFLFDPLITAAGTPITMFFLQEGIKSEWSVNVPWQLTTVVAILLVGAVGYLGIQRSLRVTIALGLAEIAVVVFVGIALIIKAKHGLHLAPLGPTLSPTGSHGILFGLIYSILAFAGFESVAPLAAETRNPRHNLPLAIIVSIVVSAAVLLIAAYATVAGWGIAGMPTTFPSAANPYYHLANSIFTGAAVLILLALINSTIAANIASQNAASRVWFAMGRTRTLPRAMGSIHARYRTPWVAIAFQTVLSLVLSLGIGEWLGPVAAFGFLGLIVTLALIGVYAMGNIAVPVFYRREHRHEFNIYVHLLLPLAATVVLAGPLYVSLHPFPIYPYYIAVIVVVVWFAAGIASVSWLSARRPEALNWARELITSNQPAE